MVVIIDTQFGVHPKHRNSARGVIFFEDSGDTPLAVFSHSSIGNRSFSYRAPRFKMDSPIDLVIGDYVTIGACTEISEAGLLATFALPVTAGLNGIVSLYSGSDRLQAPVHIETVRGDEVAMKIVTSSEEQLKSLRSFIKLLVQRGSTQVVD